MNTIKKHLENAWKDGFFYELRSGRFSESAFKQLKYEFDNLRKEDIDLSDTRLISLLWFIPLFVNWQEDRLEKNGVSKATVTEISDYFYTQCEKILGLP